MVNGCSYEVDDAKFEILELEYLSKFEILELEYLSVSIGVP